jgi:hypothetical protein
VKSESRSLLVKVIALFLVLSATPEILYFLYNLHSAGSLTVGNGLYISSLTIILNGLAATLFWFTTAEPIRKSRINH